METFVAIAAKIATNKYSRCILHRIEQFVAVVEQRDSSPPLLLCRGAPGREAGLPSPLPAPVVDLVAARAAIRSQIRLYFFIRRSLKKFIDLMHQRPEINVPYFRLSVESGNTMVNSNEKTSRLVLHCVPASNPLKETKNVKPLARVARRASFPLRKIDTMQRKVRGWSLRSPNRCSTNYCRPPRTRPANIDHGPWPRCE